MSITNELLQQIASQQVSAEAFDYMVETYAQSDTLFLASIALASFYAQVSYYVWLFS